MLSIVRFKNPQGILMTRKHQSAESRLSKAIEKTSAVKKELELAEDELAIAHAVLETKLIKTAHDAEVGAAIKTTAVAKERVGNSAKELDEVKDVLEGENKGAAGATT
jgi:hypothetical protein